MAKTYFLTLLTAVFYLISCSESSAPKTSEGAGQEIFVDVDRMDSTLDLTPYIDTIQFTVLQEAPGGYLGSVDRVLYIHDHYVVLDGTVTVQAFVFNAKGEFVKPLIELGKGPNEGFQVNAIWKNNSGNLQALDFASRRVFTFDSLFQLTTVTDYPDARYLSVAQIPHSSDYLASSAYNSFNSAPEEKEHLLTLLDTGFKARQRFFPILDALRGANVPMGEGSFFAYKDALRYFKTFDQSIYTVDASKKLDTVYSIVYSKNELTPALFEELALKAPDKQLSYIKYPALYAHSFFYSNWYENDSFASFYSISDSKRFFTLFDKGNQRVTSAYELRATINGQLVEIPHLRFHDDQTAYLVIHTASEGIDQLALYQHVLKDLPEEGFVLMKVRFR
jgi:hypothetical protein